MEFPKLVYSNFNNKVDMFKEDANKLVKDLESLDIVYLDPPYNQHSYSSNYFYAEFDS
nr:MAG TPA: D12 class N6 adenine specific DNA methyltransferase [Caudoviricetes sp.]